MLTARVGGDGDGDGDNDGVDGSCIIVAMNSDYITLVVKNV